VRIYKNSLAFRKIAAKAQSNAKFFNLLLKAVVIYYVKKINVYNKHLLKCQSREAACNLEDLRLLATNE